MFRSKPKQQQFKTIQDKRKSDLQNFQQHFQAHLETIDFKKNLEWFELIEQVKYKTNDEKEIVLQYIFTYKIKSIIDKMKTLISETRNILDKVLPPTRWKDLLFYLKELYGLDKFKVAFKICSNYSKSTPKEQFIEKIRFVEKTIERTLSVKIDVSNKNFQKQKIIYMKHLA